MVQILEKKGEVARDFREKLSTLIRKVIKVYIIITEALAWFL